MVATSTSEHLQSGTILSEVDISRLILKPACIPILIGVQRFQQLTSVNPEDAVKIATFIAKSQRFAEIDIYWAQATKLLVGGKHSISKSSVSFDNARALDQFWIVHGELSSHSLDLPEKLTTIFSNRSYLKVLNHLLPILISCYSTNDLHLLLKPLVASNLAIDHISNIAMNLPSICGHIALVLQNLLRDTQEPAIIWRCSKVLMKISSCDIHLAVIVRSSFVKLREHPLLCLEITSRFIKDTEQFIDEELCSNSDSESISGSWLLKGLRNSDLLLISQSAIEKLRVLLSTDMGDAAFSQEQWQIDVCQCVRIIATCNSVDGSITYNSSSSSSQGKAEAAKNTVAVLIEAAEAVLEHSPDSSLLMKNRGDYIEYTLRLAIVLLVVNFACLAASGRRIQVESTVQDRGAQQLEKAAFASQLASAISALTLFSEREASTHSDAAPEAARCFSLCFRLAVTFRSQSALRNLCAIELSLDHFTDFLAEDGSDLPKLASTMAQIISPPSRMEQKDRTNAFCSEFEALIQPSIICGLTERAGDWLNCLSLMFSTDLMVSFRYRSRDSSGSHEADDTKMIISESNSDDSTDACAGSTHALMMSVLQSVRWPPHSSLHVCIDRWLIRCVGVGIRIGSCADRTPSVEKECPRLGLPLLQNEATDLCRTLVYQSSRIVTLSAPITPPCSDPFRDLKKIRRLRNRNSIRNSSGNGKGNEIRNRNRKCNGDIIIPALVEPSDVYTAFLTQCRYTVNIRILDPDSHSEDLEAECSVSSVFEPGNGIDSSDEDIDDIECTMDMGWVGVVACYSALHYASLSMFLDNTVSTDPGHSCDVTYNGPYVCDIRLLPVKRAVEFLLSKCLECSAVQEEADKNMTVCRRRDHRAEHACHRMLSRIIDLINELCPELLMKDRCGCFNFENVLHHTTLLPHIGNRIAQAEDLKEQKDQKEKLFLDTVTDLLSEKGNGSGVFSPQYRMVSELILGMRFTASSLSPDSVLGRLLEVILSLALDAPRSKQRCAGLWTVWRALHDCHACPQQLELLTLFIMVRGDPSASCPKLFTSYEQLIQEPLVLFSLPLRILSNLFALRLVIFITRGALIASAGSVKRALAIRHRVAQSFLAASMQHRSTTEASLYLHKDTFLHLQNVLAVRLALSLWQELYDQSEDMAVETRLVLNDFMFALFEENSTVCVLLLCHQLTPEGIELLLSCAPSVALMVCEVHLSNLQSSITVFETLLTVAALEIDPTLTSTSLIFTTSANNAAILAAQCEVPPEDVERLLMHSLCILRFSNGQYSGLSTQDNLHAIVRRIASAMPNFLLFATNSLNAHLLKEDVRAIEQLSAAILNILFESYPKYAAKLHNFAHNAEAVVTTNTAVIGLVVKSWGSKGHPKAEETITMKTRPAIKALRRIVKRADQRHRKTNAADQPVQEQQVDLSKHTQEGVVAMDSGAMQVQITGKNCRAEHADVTAEDTTMRKKPKIGPSANSTATASASASATASAAASGPARI